MTSIAQLIWKEIQEDIIIRRALEKGIISIKNLALYIIKKNKLQTTSDAVISAIRRYKEERPLEKTFETASRVIAKSEDIRIITNIIEIALEKNSENQKLLQKLFSSINYDKGDILLIMQAEKSLKILINKRNKDKIISIFSKKSIMQIQEDIAEINIQLADEAVKTPGIITVLTTELMLQNINIVETMSCVPEMLFFVKQKDVVRTYDLLFSLCMGNVK